MLFDQPDLLPAGFAFKLKIRFIPEDPRMNRIFLCFQCVFHYSYFNDFTGFDLMVYSACMLMISELMIRMITPGITNHK